MGKAKDCGGVILYIIAIYKIFVHNHDSNNIFFLFTMMDLQENKEGLELLKTAIAKAGYTGKVFAKPFHVYCYFTFKYLFMQGRDGFPSAKPDIWTDASCIVMDVL